MNISLSKRGGDGRFVVEWLFNKILLKMGFNKAFEVKSFSIEEKKHFKEEKVHKGYSNFVKEFIGLVHSEKFLKRSQRRKIAITYDTTVFLIQIAPPQSKGSLLRECKDHFRNILN